MTERQNGESSGNSVSPGTEDQFPDVSKISDLSKLASIAQANSKEMRDLQVDRLDLEASGNTVGLADLEKRVALLQKRQGRLIRRREEIKRAEAREKQATYERVERPIADLQGELADTIRKLETLGETVQKLNRTMAQNERHDSARNLLGVKRSIDAALSALSKTPKLLRG